MVVGVVVVGAALSADVFNNTASSDGFETATSAATRPSCFSLVASFVSSSRAVAAAMAYLLLRQQDAVGLTVFDDAIRGRVDFGSRRSHLVGLLAALDAPDPVQKTDIYGILEEVAAAQRRRGIVVIVEGRTDRRYFPKLRQALPDGVGVRVAAREDLEAVLRELELG